MNTPRKKYGFANFINPTKTLAPSPKIPGCRFSVGQKVYYLKANGTKRYCFITSIEPSADSFLLYGEWLNEVGSPDPINSFNSDKEGIFPYTDDYDSQLVSF